MQKNKFIHEDIKAVCNRAAKKLVVLGLVGLCGSSFSQSAFAGGCLSRPNKGNSSKSQMLTEKKRVYAGESFLVIEKGAICNTHGKKIICVGDEVICDNGETITISPFLTRITVLFGQNGIVGWGKNAAN